MKRTLIALLLLSACGQRSTGTTITANSDLSSALEETDGGLPDDPSALSETESADVDAAAAGEAIDSEDARPPEGMPTAPNDAEARGIPAFLAANPNGKVFFVRLAWGNFPVNPANKGKPVDYTGGVSASSGDLLRHVRSWHFEANDGIIRPRTDRASIAFDSTITVASDGLHFFALAPDGAGSLTITLGTQYSKTIDLASIDRLREQTDSATAGQKVRLSVHEVQKRTLACQSGSLQGRWITKTGKDGRSVARLVGRVLDETGTAEARVVGIAGQRKNGKNVFFLRVFKTGSLVARVRGTYDPAAHAFTAAAFGPLGRVTIGGTRGTYADGIDGAPGTFEGTWQIGADCQDKADADDAEQPE